MDVQEAVAEGTASAENGEVKRDGKKQFSMSPGDILEGRLVYDGSIHADGKVEGELEATGDNEITGRVNGAVTAYNRLVVGSAGSLIGSEVRVARLTVEDGATFTGKVSMGKHEPPKSAEPEPVLEPVPAAQP